jgi:hypothetical protein
MNLFALSNLYGGKGQDNDQNDNLENENDNNNFDQVVEHKSSWDWKLTTFLIISILLVCITFIYQYIVFKEFSIGGICCNLCCVFIVTLMLWGINSWSPIAGLVLFCLCILSSIAGTVSTMLTKKSLGKYMMELQHMATSSTSAETSPTNSAEPKPESS